MNFNYLFVSDYYKTLMPRTVPNPQCSLINAYWIIVNTWVNGWMIKFVRQKSWDKTLVMSFTVFIFKTNCFGELRWLCIYFLYCLVPSKMTRSSWHSARALSYEGWLFVPLLEFSLPSRLEEVKSKHSPPTPSLSYSNLPRKWPIKNCTYCFWLYNGILWAALVVSLVEMGALSIETL